MPNTREKIIRAAIELFSEFSYDQVSLNQIANEVGIRSGSIYNHFASKEEIIDGILVYIDNYFEHFHYTPEAVVEALARESPLDLLLRVTAAYHEGGDALRHAILRFFFVQMFQSEKVHRAAMRHLIQLPIELCIRETGTIVESGAIPPCDNHTLSELWVRSTFVNSMWVAHNKENHFDTFYTLDKLFATALVRGAVPIDVEFESPVPEQLEHPQPADVRERILRAALDLFSAQGYDVTSMRQIAKQVGIRQSSIYNHFAGKREIMQELIQMFHRYTLRYPHSPLSGFKQYAEDRDTAALVRSLSRDFPPFVYDIVRVCYRLMFREQFTTPEMYAFFADSVAADCDQVAADLQCAIDAGAVPPCDACTFATAYVYTQCSLNIDAALCDCIPKESQALRARIVRLLVGMLLEGKIGDAHKLSHT